MFKKSEERFKTIYKEGAMDGTKIIVDTQTGVHYLYTWSGYSGGLTPLLDSSGNVIVQTDYKEQ
ncbi:MAG: DUF6440 family protein [bacterium]|nr:DUF6440 family protein [bacterium]